MRVPLALLVIAVWPCASAFSQAPALSQAPDKASEVAPLKAPVVAPMAVCMQQNDPPLSLRAGDKPTGFDLALSSIIAQRLGRDLRVQWFVSRDDPDANLAKDANALLSDGRCQLVAEYPLTEGTLERPRSPTAKLPPFDGAKPDDRRRWVEIGAIATTRPYRLDTLTVVLSAHDADHKVTTLGDLDGLKIGVQIATLADAIAMQYGDGRLSQHVVHMPDARDLFGKLQSGELDAALVDLRAFDAWRLRHGSGGLTASGYQHSLGFNMAFAGLASDAALVEQVNAVIAELQTHDAIAPLAASSGLTFISPRSPDVRQDVRMTDLHSD
jgi:ABC-type amino acid transport substrate-binding protein